MGYKSRDKIRRFEKFLGNNILLLSFKLLHEKNPASFLYV